MPSTVPTPRHLAGRLLDWFAAHARDLPWRHTRDPYAIWISEVMLQQTQVQTVVPYWERWMRALPTVASLATARLDEVLKLWEGLGYYHRARNLQRAARQIVHEHAGAFPQQPEQVLSLPGIGPYTAGAIASLAWNLPTPVLDGNVIRVLARLFGIRQRVDRAPTRRRLGRLAAALVQAALDHPLPRRVRSRSDWRSRRVLERPCGALNEALMELGAIVCTPRQPRCEQCPVKRHCVANQAGLVERLPLMPRPPRAVARRCRVFVCERHGRWLARQRPEGVVNAGLWEFPNVEVTGRASTFDAARTLFGPSVQATQPLLTVRHAITRHRITLEIHRVTLSGPLAVGGRGRWLTAIQLEARAFAAAHRRIVRHLSLATRRPEERNKRNKRRLAAPASAATLCR